MQKFDQMQTLSDNIGKTLTALGWTKTRLGEECGIARENISRIVAGNASVTLGTAARIAGALNVSLSDLLREDYEPEQVLEEHAA